MDRKMSEEDIKDKERSGLMYDKSKILEDYGQKADKLLRSIQKNFENDHTSFCVGAGSLAAIASVVIIALDKSEFFAIMLLVMGFTTIIAGIYLRLVSTKRKLEGLPRILEFEKEHARIKQRERLYSRLWFEGKPDCLTEEQFNLLLIDQDVVPTNDGS
jgi:hypothetical protein